MKLVKSVRSKSFDEKNIYLLFILISFVIFIIFSFCFAAKQSFWADEMWMVGFVSKKNTIFDTLWYYLTIEVTNTPLYAFVLYWWYRICPFGEQYLLIVSQIATIIGILYCVKLGKKIGGYLYASIVATVLLTSGTIFCNVAWELRAYSFLFLFSAMMLYYYYQYKETPETSTAIKLGVVMALLVYSHYFGGIEIFLLGITDFFGFIKTKNKNYKWMISYSIPVITFTPWFIAAMICKTKAITEFWPAIPQLKDIKGIIGYLLDNNSLLISLFAFGIIYVFINYSSTSDSLKNSGFIRMLSAHFIFVVFSVYIYSGVINRKGSIWVDRYFLGFMPYIAIIIAYGLWSVIKDIIRNSEERTKLIYSIVFASYIVLVLFSYTNVMALQESPKYSAEAFREATAKICENDAEKVYVYVNLSEVEKTGWEEIYFTKSVQFFGGSKWDEIEEMNPDSIYVSTLHSSISDEEFAYFNSNYKEVWRDDKLRLVYYSK